MFFSPFLVFVFADLFSSLLENTAALLVGRLTVLFRCWRLILNAVIHTIDNKIMHNHNLQYLYLLHLGIWLLLKGRGMVS